jgi:hypothetical protein
LRHQPPALTATRTTAIIGPATTDYAYDRTDALISRTDGDPPTFLNTTALPV